MLVSYARGSTAYQQPQPQLDALAAAGCERVFDDHGVSGAALARPDLEKAISFVRPGEDVLIVWKLDRLGRSIPDLVNVVTDLQKRGIRFRSLKETMIDTTSASGTLIVHVFSAIARVRAWHQSRVHDGRDRRCTARLHPLRAARDIAGPMEAGTTLNQGGSDTDCDRNRHPARRQPPGYLPPPRGRPSGGDAGRGQLRRRRSNTSIRGPCNPPGRAVVAMIVADSDTAPG
ncbi:recombinase family protein (plasmid) [Polymorphobacter sp. PAMC 29334]|nr:recombinase family protein [Polymorphobacter sp. PAMC 29334]